MLSRFICGVKLSDVHFSKPGELRDRTYDDQLNAASSLNLLLAAIVCVEHAAHPSLREEAAG